MLYLILIFMFKDGQTPLMVAVEKGHLQVVKVFLKEQTKPCEVNLQEYVSI